MGTSPTSPNSPLLTPSTLFPDPRPSIDRRRLGDSAGIPDLDDDATLATRRFATRETDVFFFHNRVVVVAPAPIDRSRARRPIQSSNSSRWLDARRGIEESRRIDRDRRDARGGECAARAVDDFRAIYTFIRIRRATIERASARGEGRRRRWRRRGGGRRCRRRVGGGPVGSGLRAPSVGRRCVT